MASNHKTSQTAASTRPAAIGTEEVEHPALPWSGDRNDLFGGEAKQALEQTLLPDFLKSQRWFGGKARRMASLRIADWGHFSEPVEAFPLLLEVTFATGERDLYFLPVAIAHGAAAVHLLQSMRPWVITRLEGPDDEAVLVDALAEDAFCSSLLSMIGEDRELSINGGTIRAEGTAAYAALRGPDDPLPVIRGPAASSNSLVFYGRRLLLKLFRRLEIGTNPDFEVGRFLAEETSFSRTPQVAGKIEYHSRTQGGPFTLGLLQSLVPNQGDGWDHALDELSRYYDRASERMFSGDSLLPDPRPLSELAAAAPPAVALETIAAYLRAAATLGRRTAEMHVALAGGASSPDFSPQPFTAADLAALRKDILFQGEQAFSALRDQQDRLPAGVASESQALLTGGPAALARLTDAWTTVPDVVKTRVHGDYHLGQVLWVDQDYFILDFEGEPTRTVADRRAKFSPLRDVAGMLRSYHYAAYAGLFAFAQDRPADLARLAPWADVWQQWVSAAFLAEYRRTAEGAPFLPREPADFAFLLDGFMLAKALYELAYELNNRPDWVRIPLGGVLRLIPGLHETTEGE